MPNGFIYEFQLHSAHGDAYYIGLNGLEFYDEHGEQIGLTEQSNSMTFPSIRFLVCFAFRIDIAACPHSVNTLNKDGNGGVEDARTPENLIDGDNDQMDGTHCWIAPILPNVVCRKMSSRMRVRKSIDICRSIEYL